jgi:hypothetical protein
MKHKKVSFCDEVAKTDHLRSVITAIKFECVNITPLLVPVVPEEYSIAAVSD